MKSPILAETKQILCAVFIAFFMSIPLAFANDDIVDISQQTLVDATPDKFLIVDVRTPEEFAEGHVPNAINIPLADIKENTAMFNDKSQAIVMYCRSGYRAGKALDILQEKGFTNLHHLDGDMLEWKDAELPIETGSK